MSVSRELRSRLLPLLVLVAGAFALLVWASARTCCRARGPDRRALYRPRRLGGGAGLHLGPCAAPRPRLQRETPGSWWIVQPTREFAQQQRIDVVLDNLARAQVEPVDEAQGRVSDADVGLSPPEHVIAFRVGDRTETLSLGAAEPLGHMLYARRSGEDRVVLVTRNLATLLQDNAEEFVDRALLRGLAGNVSHVLVEGPRGRMQAEHTGSAWALRAPEAVLADDDRLDQLVRSLQFVQQDSVLQARPTPDSLHAAGLPNAEDVARGDLRAPPPRAGRPGAEAGRRVPCRRLGRGGNRGCRARRLRQAAQHPARRAQPGGQPARLVPRAPAAAARARARRVAAAGDRRRDAAGHPARHRRPLDLCRAGAPGRQRGGVRAPRGPLSAGRLPRPHRRAAGARFTDRPPGSRGASLSSAGRRPVACARTASTSTRWTARAGRHHPAPRRGPRAAAGRAGPVHAPAARAAALAARWTWMPRAGRASRSSCRAAARRSRSSASRPTARGAATTSGPGARRSARTCCAACAACAGSRRARCALRLARALRRGRRQPAGRVRLRRPEADEPAEVFGLPCAVPPCTGHDDVELIVHRDWIDRLDELGGPLVRKPAGKP